MTTPARIVDTHVHLWDLNKNDYPWMRVKRDFETFAGDTSSAKQTYLLRDLLADTEGLPVEKFVHIEGHMGTDDPSEETAWLQGIADTEGNPQGIVGFATLHDPLVEQLLERHARYRSHRGIRHSLNWHEDRFYSMCDRPDYLTDPAWRHGYGLLAKYRMSFDLQIYPHQLADAAALCRDFPDVPLIVEHCGFPIERDPEGMARWRSDMRRLANLPNSTVKISGLVLLDHQWTKESLMPLIRETVEIFGPDRAVFASDFPIDRVYIRYGQWVDAVAGAISDLDATDQDKVFYQNAVRVYRL